ncbi:MAG TPA: hypothetical protein VEJ63_24435 [Planctomycetota bacterium]|nr:hypothetical protein [Planctomycetota bacterium]
MNEQQNQERSALGDQFDRVIRSLDGLPDVTKSKATTVRAQSKVLELTQQFIVQTYRQAEEGDTIFVEYIGAQGSLRLVLPPAVAACIARQRDLLSGKVRSKVAKRLAAERKAMGIKPGFMLKS